MVKINTKVMAKRIIISRVIFVFFILPVLLSVKCVAVADPTANTNMQANVKDTLVVSITTPVNWASGNIDTFLRNKITLNVVSNNSAGFTATMTSKTTSTSLTNVINNTVFLPTLTTTTTRQNFPANYWGYSIDDTDAGNSASNYSPMVALGATPIPVFSSTSATSGSKDIYFGAKADITQMSGTYNGVIVINVVSGVISNENPVVPVSPAYPQPVPGQPISLPGGGTNGTTVYSYNRHANVGTDNETSTSVTEVSDGNNKDLYDGYAPPQGVRRYSSSNSAGPSVNGTSILVAGLTAASAITASSGLLLFFLARKRNEDEEDDNNNSQTFYNY